MILRALLALLALTVAFAQTAARADAQPGVLDATAWERGQDLVRRGVTFVDLTNIYANNRDVLYRDNCCHVNTAGQRIIVDAMVKTIRSQIGAPSR